MSNINQLKSELLAAQYVLSEKRSQLAFFELDESDYEEGYKELIDECTEVVVIMGISFTPSRILEELDPVAYSCGLSDYVDSIDKSSNSEYQELESAIEDLEEEIESLESQIEELENND